MQPLSEEGGGFAWDSVYFGFYCQNSGMAAYTGVCLPMYDIMYY